MKKVLCLFSFCLVAFSFLNAQSLRQANLLYKEENKYYLMENGRKTPVNEKVITRSAGFAIRLR